MAKSSKNVQNLTCEAFFVFFFLRHGRKTSVRIRGPKNIASVAFREKNNAYAEIPDSLVVFTHPCLVLIVFAYYLNQSPGRLTVLKSGYT